MRAQSAFDIYRRNILPSADDDVLLAIDDMDIVFVIPYRHVARMEPWPRHYSGGCFRLAEVTVHHVVAGDYDLTDCGHVTGNVRHVSVHNANLSPGNGPARHGLVAKTIGLIGIDDRGFFAGAACHGGGFCQ